MIKHQILDVGRRNLLILKRNIGLQAEDCSLQHETHNFLETCLRPRPFLCSFVAQLSEKCEKKPVLIPEDKMGHRSLVKIFSDRMYIRILENPARNNVTNRKGKGSG